MADRIVMVTGATGGLGRAVVEAFRAAGDTVAEVSRSAQDFGADLTRAEEAESVVSRVMAKHGRIDVIAHLMGGFTGGTPVAESTLDVWNRMLDFNFKSALYVCRSVIPHLRPGGRIIAVGSRVGVQPAEGLGAYGVSKAALNALVQTLALELKDGGVTANVVLPSTIDTEAKRSWGSAQEQARWVKPESIAQTILWLASDGAADVNGALIPVYGRA